MSIFFLEQTIPFISPNYCSTARIKLVDRRTNTGEGNKIVLRGYSREPIVEEEGEYLSIRAGEPCGGSSVTDNGDSTSSVDSPNGGGDGSTSTTGDSGATASSATKLAGFGLPLLFGGRSGSVGVVGSSLLAMAFSTTMMSPMVSGQDITTAECEIVPIEVDIFVVRKLSLLQQIEFITFSFCFAHHQF